MPAMDITDIVLTDEQQGALDHLLAFPKDIQTLGGFGGTGKSVVVKHLKIALPDFAVCAFTGKAANVLRRRGIIASTIHSLIYQPVEVECFDDDTDEYLGTKLVWSLRSEPALLNCRGFLVDEASMIGNKLYDDLSSFGLPIIFVGDHGQLEPVGDRSFNLMKSPDVTLETVHRNAGEIEHFANFLRRGGKASNWKKSKHTVIADNGSPKVIVVPNDLMGNLDWRHYDQVICAYNKTRVDFNVMVREELGYPEDKPVVGDRVMCLKNHRGLGLFNGMQGVITNLDKRGRLTFLSESKEYTAYYDPEAFNRVKRPEWESRDDHRLPFDYAYCVTAHKFQGDETDNVLVLEQKCSAWDHKRWAYTAASRAKQSLTWVLPAW